MFRNKKALPLSLQREKEKNDSSQILSPRLNAKAETALYPKATDPSCMK